MKREIIFACIGVLSVVGICAPSLTAVPDPIGYRITSRDQAVVQIYRLPPKSCQTPPLTSAVVRIDPLRSKAKIRLLR